MDDICASCLCKGRKLCSLETTGFGELFSEIFNEIQFTQKRISFIHICWECKAKLKNWHKFKNQAQSSYRLFLQHCEETPYTSLSNTPNSTLSIQSVFVFDCKDLPLDSVKVEPVPNDGDVKREVDYSDDDIVYGEPVVIANEMSLQKPKRKLEEKPSKNSKKKIKIEKSKIAPKKSLSKYEMRRKRSPSPEADEVDAGDDMSDDHDDVKEEDVENRVPGKGLHMIDDTKINKLEMSKTRGDRSKSQGGEGNGAEGRATVRGLSYPHPRPCLSEDQISAVLNYGSEDDEDNDMDSYIFEQPGCLASTRVERDFEVDVEMERGEDEAAGVTESPHREHELPTAAPENPHQEDEEDAPLAADQVQQFHFDWKRISENEIAGSRRCTFVGDEHGKATLHYDTAYDAFTAIWDRDIMQRIASQTNVYAQQHAEFLFQHNEQSASSRIQFWKDTDVDELYTYFAIYLAMGFVVKSTILSYWSTKKDIFSTPGFSATMSLRRFQLLNTCLHFADNNDMVASNLTAPQAKLFKIQPIVDHLNTKFPRLYNLGRNVALDESLTMWKGWLSINQKISTKEAKRGIKTYEVCESETGYLWRFEVHSGPSREDGCILGAIPCLVLRLLRGLEEKGHTIWMDNYYNSPALSRVLKSKDFDVVGTIRQNCRFVPYEIAKLKQNTLATNETMSCTSGDVDIIAWRDKRLVCLTSTYHGDAISEDSGKLVPNVVLDYNICMGGVDRKDQLLAMYPLERKRMQSWYKKFFRRLMNVTVLNSYVLFNRSPTAPSRKSHRQFRQDLILELLSRHGRDPSRQSLVRSDNPSPRVLPLECIAHFPEKLPMGETGEKRTMRRVCVHCKKRATAICRPCNAPLCAFTCFKPYHSGNAGKTV